MARMISATRSRRRLTRAGLIAGAALGLTLSAGAAASGAQAPAPGVAAPAISVTPSSGLQDGQTVTVSGTGLTAGTVYHVGECAAVATNVYACAPTNVDVTAGSDGALQTPLTVMKTFTGHDVNNNEYPVDCTQDDCVVGVYDDAFNGGAVPVTFS